MIAGGMDRLNDPEIVCAITVSHRIVLWAVSRLPVLLDLTAWRMSVVEYLRRECLVDGRLCWMAGRPDGRTTSSDLLASEHVAEMRERSCGS